VPEFAAREIDLWNRIAIRAAWRIANSTSNFLAALDLELSEAMLFLCRRVPCGKGNNE
jgi:hypothetical protein